MTRKNNGWLSNKGFKAIEALAHYKFMTFQQMVKVGVATHASNLSEPISDLIESNTPLIKRYRRSVTDQYVHYLTKRGAMYLVRHHKYNLENIKFPIGKIKKSTQDARHRIATIDFEIELCNACKHANFDLLLCDRYFDTVGNNRRDRDLKSLTAFLYNNRQSVKADLIFKIDVGDNQEELYTLEIERGEDTKKAIDKIIPHHAALLKGSLNYKMNHLKGYRSLWVFQYEATMISTITRLQKDDTLMQCKDYFLFKTLDSISTDNFWSGWLNMAGDPHSLYYK